MLRLAPLAWIAGLCLLLVAAEAVWAQEGFSPSLSPDLVGTWVVDVDASLADIPHHPEWVDSSETEKKRTREVLERRAQAIELRFSADSMILEHRGQETVFPCRKRYDNGELSVLSCQLDGLDTPLTISVLFLEPKKIKLFSSGTDDTDIYVWRAKSSTTRPERLGEEARPILDKPAEPIRRPPVK